MEPKFTTVNGIKLAYFVFGSGPPLLFVHGHRSDALRFWAIVEKLGEKFKVYAPDLPGFGRSEELKNWHSMENYEKILEEFIEKVNLNDFTLVGGSMGATISILLAQSIPKKIKKIVLIVPYIDNQVLKVNRVKRLLAIVLLALFPRNRPLVFLANKIIKNDRIFKNLLKLSFPKEVRKKEIIDYEVKQWRIMSMKIWAQTLYSLLTFQLNNLKVLKIPNIAIFSQKDQYVDITKAKTRIEKIFPNSEIIVLNNLTHVPKGELSDEFLNNLDELFKKV